MIGLAPSQGFAARFARRVAAEAGAPALLAPPSVSGEARIGAALAATDGSWSGDPAPTLARQWLRDGAPIPGATGSSLLLTAADDGAAIAFRVTATNAHGARMATTAPAEARYRAPTLAAPLPDLAFVAGREAAPANLSAGFSVAGDPGLAGATFSLAAGSAALPEGLSFSPGGVLSGAPAAPAGPLAIVARCANSGGHADAAFALSVTEAANASRVVIAYLGQSNLEYGLASDGAYINGTDPYPTVSAENVRVILGPGATETPIQDILATNAVCAARGVNLCVAAMASHLSRIAPGTEFVILDLAVTGTGRRELADDDDADRQWSRLQALVDYCETSYGPPDVVAEFWSANDGPSMSKFGPNFAPLYIGRLWGGSAFTLGAVNPDWNPAGTTTIDHCLWDAEAAPDAKGRGVFTRAATKWTVMDERTHIAGAGVGAFHSDPRVPALRPGAFHPYLMHLAMTEGGHALVDDFDGQVGLFRGMVVPILDKLGLYAGQPRITGYEMGPSGAYCDFTVSLPNGGDLTTLRALEGRGAADAGWLTRQEVHGFLISRRDDAVTAWTQIYNSAETGEDANYRGLVTIENSGTGTAPNRTATIRVTPDVPFAEGDRIKVVDPQGALPGDPEGKGTHNGPFKAFADLPIETVAALRNDEDEYPFPGFPVAKDPFMVIAGETVPSEPAAWWTQESGGPYFPDPSALPAGTFRIVYRTKLRLPEAGRVRGEPLGARYLLSQQSDAISLFVNLNANASQLYLSRVYDSAAASLLPATVMLADPLRTREWLEIEVDIDLAAAKVVCKLNGATVRDVALNAGTGLFAAASNRKLTMGARTPTGASPIHPGIEFAYHELSYDNGSGLTLRKRVEGDAAAVNADGWKLPASGGMAT